MIIALATMCSLMMFLVNTGFAQETEAITEVVTETQLNSGDTAWMLVSTVFVLLMTIPGLALFYGGMVRKKMFFPL